MNNKISTLVSKQVPSFVREEYPRFISFLEAYYEFLQQEYPELNISQNNVLEQVDKLKYVSDVDVSLNQFEEHFFNNFLPYLPRNVATSKEILIKNILPLYLSKGSEKSFKLLFRMLFDENIKISYPRDNILRASDGRWTIEKVLNISQNFYSQYTSDGQTVEYILPEKYLPSEFSVFVNDSLVTNYTYFIDYRKLVFNVAPSVGSIIRINYTNFNPKLLENRQLIGQTSSSTTIVERVTESRLVNTVFYEFFINQKNTIGTFLNNEVIKSTIYDSVLIPVYFTPFSTIDSIVVTNPGAKYNIGDAVPIFGDSVEDAIAVVDAVTTGVIEAIIPDNGGIGFKVNNSVYAVGYSTNSFSAKVQTVDASGIFSSNTITVNDDVISDYATITIDDVYGFPSNAIATNTSIISETISSRVISDLGPITSISVDVSTINSTLSPTIDVTPESVANGTLTIKDLGIIGKIDINDGGVNYNVGEYLIFTNNGTYAGYGANAEIAAVNANGSITQIKINNGGLSYQQGLLPSVSVNSTTGSGANLSVFGIMGDEEVLLSEVADGIAGAIQRIRLIYSGLNYLGTPVVDLSQFGDGTATAEAIIRDSQITLPGRWETSDGKISNRDIKLQGEDYYIDFSYVITSQVEFKKYKEIVKNLLHPAGLINYAIYTKTTEIDAQSTINIESTIEILLN